MPPHLFFRILQPQNQQMHPDYEGCQNPDKPDRGQPEWAGPSLHRGSGKRNAGEAGVWRGVPLHGPVSPLFLS